MQIVDSIERHRTVFIGAFLVAATVAVYGQAIGFPFIIYDDPPYVRDNEHVNRGLTLEGIVWAFTSDHGAHWHPLTGLSHMLDCQLFGLEPGGHHAVNILLHVANTLLVFGVLTSMTGAPWRSGLVAALFALHPLRVESVAWITERKDVLSTLFGLLAMAAYVRYTRRPAVGRYLLTAMLLALSLLAKPMLVTLPLVFLLLDYWPLDRTRLGPAALVIEKLPLLVLSAASSVATYLVQQSAGAMHYLEPVPLDLRAANAVVSYVRYIGKMFWPTGLSVLYPHPNQPGGTPWAPWQVAGAAAVIVTVSLLVLVAARRRKYFLTGWLWYLGTLVPTIGLVQVGEQAMADRFTYVPLIGLFITIAWGGAGLVDRLPAHHAMRFAAPIGVGVVLAALMVCTWFQLQYWRDSESLCKRAIDVADNNPTMHNNLGLVYHESGRHKLALDSFNTALRYKPKYAMAHLNRGNTYRQLGEYDLAFADYNRAIVLQPYLAAAYNNRGTTYGQLGQYERAIEDCTRAIKLKPDHADAYFNRANAYRPTGNYQPALDDFTRAIERKHDYAEAYFGRAQIYRTLSQYEPALADYHVAIQLDPDNAEAYYERGNTYGRMARYHQAVADFTRAIELKPDYVHAYYNRGNAHHEAARYEPAIADFTRTIELKPDDPAPYATRAASYVAKGQLAEARADVKYVHKLGGQVPQELINALAAASR